jgi:VWFA-related protein
MLRSSIFAALALATSVSPGQTDQPYSLNTQSNLVVVPTQVKSKQGEFIYGLEANQFDLKDNGLRQRVHLDEAPDGTGLSLVVLVQCSGAAVLEVTKMKGLEAMIESVVGGAPHEIAIVSYGAGPTLLGDFTSDPTNLASAVSEVKPCREDGVATLDAVYYATRLLEVRRNNYRRAILLISETRDHGSHSKPQEVIAALGRSNTVVESVAYSPARDELVRDLKNGPSGPPNWLPLLVFAVSAMKSNASSTLATVSGGEYANFGTQKGFDQAIIRISNQIHNYYQLSFQPNLIPAYGFHSLSVAVPSYPNAMVKSRASYWSGTIQPTAVPCSPP